MYIDTSIQTTFCTEKLACDFAYENSQKMAVTILDIVTAITLNVISLLFRIMKQPQISRSFDLL